jgi:hypothetical protein
MLLNMCPLANFIDELAYYAYHSAQYDYYFTVIVEFSWNITNSKWVPTFLQEPYEYLDNKITGTVALDSSRVVTPARFLKKNEDVIFINNTRSIWISNTPLVILVFALLHFLVHRCSHPILTKVLSTFYSYTFLLVNLVDSDIQSLSFRASLQFLYFVPTESYLSIFNLAFSVFTLFIFLFASITLYLILYKRTSFKLDGFVNNFKSYIFITQILFLRLLTGFIHAYFSKPIIQVSALLAIHSLILWIIIKASKHF